MSEHDLDFVGVKTEDVAHWKKQEKPKKSQSPVAWITLKDGDEMLLRLLPPWTSEGYHAHKPHLRTFQHWDVGAKKERVICPQKVTDDMPIETVPCYICEQVEMLFKTGNPLDEQKARRMRAGQSFIYQCVDRDDPEWTEYDDQAKEKPELVGTPKIKFLRLPWQGHSQILDFFADPDYGEICHPLNGLDIKVSRSGSGLETEYNILPKRHNSPLLALPSGDPDIPAIKGVLGKMDQLDDHPFFRYKDYQQTRAIYLGKTEEAGESTGQVTGGTSHPALPPHQQSVPYNEWVQKAQASELEAMTHEQVATWGGWQVEQIPECYAKEVNHTDSGCAACPLHVPCAVTYHAEHGSYSISADPVATGGKPLPKIGGKASTNGEVSGGVAEMTAMLDAKAKE